MRCRICDELIENPKTDMTEDGVCKKKCAPASEGLFDEGEVVIELIEVVDGGGFLEVFASEGFTSDYE